MNDSPISTDRLLSLHPKVIDIFRDFINECEKEFHITLRISQGFRTFKEQQDRYNQGRITIGKIVTNAKAGQSFHNYGLAIDLVIVKQNKTIDWNFDYKKLLKIAEKYGIHWRGSFSDNDHFELTFGYKWKQLLDKYYRKDFIKNTEFVNI